MALTKVLEGGIADDAVGNTKLDLSEDYTFTGAVSGTITTTNSGGLSVTGVAHVDFTSLPSGIKRVFVNFYGVSAGSDVAALIRLGTSSGIVTSGYGSTSATGHNQGYSDSSGIVVYGTASTNSINGIAIINNMGSNVFVSSHSARYSNSYAVMGGGYKDLGATLTQIRIASVSGGNFDSGLVNLMYQL